MPPPELPALEVALRASWCAETCDPVDLPWSPANPAKGQCGVSALVVHDHLGGELVLADVLHADGSPQGVHLWNVLPDGTEVDLTAEQFLAGEVVQAGRRLVRPDGPPSRQAHAYELLRSRVAHLLG